MNDTFRGIVAWVILATVIVGLLFGAMSGYKIYSVWSARKTGQAELAQAEQNRQIAIEEAQAKKASARLLAEAEVERARGVAKANKIVADGLGGPEGYLRYLYIENIAGSEGDIIYIPTEGGMPILEAGKR